MACGSTQRQDATSSEATISPLKLSVANTASFNSTRANRQRQHRAQVGEHQAKFLANLA